MAPLSVEDLQQCNESQSTDSNRTNLLSLTARSPLTTQLHKQLSTTTKVGLTADAIVASTALFGSNSLPAAPPPSFVSLLVDSIVDDGTVQILIVAALVSLLVGVYDDPATGWIEGVAILAAVVIVAFVTAINDYQKEQQFRKLDAVASSKPDVKVTRDGITHTITPAEVVVGDVIKLEPGDKIPGDSVLFQSDATTIEVDESSLTGEVEPILKHLPAQGDPFLLSGCNVTDGSGIAVVIAVGGNSQWGIIKKSLEKEQSQTPLQEKLDDMAALIGNIGTAAAVATMVALIFIRYQYPTVDPATGSLVPWFDTVLSAFIIAVTIVVVAVPEGLPLAVTISLAFSTKKMLADNNLIRHLAACETMGNATCICSDKTGTLTTNRMSVVDKVVMCEQVTFKAVAVCTTATIASDGRVIGNATEGALLNCLASDFTESKTALSVREAAAFGVTGGSRLFPFSSTRKRMSVLVADKPAATNGTADEANNGARRSSRKTPSKAAPSEDFGSYTLFTKGAAETVLDDCTSYSSPDGATVKLTAVKRKHFERTIGEFADRALRCIAVAHRRDAQEVVDVSEATMDDLDDLETDLVLDAIFGIADPIRPEVPQAIATCQRAGIVVRMVTGDNLATACAIAREAGIMTDDGIAIEGEELRAMTPKELDEVLPKLQVVARSSPTDKTLLVQRLNGALLPTNEEEWKEAHPGASWKRDKDKLLPGYREEWEAARENGVGEVVGVTGDGTNDGPALKSADVGLSMGISGTDVAKDASDIVILDDNFSSIVKAVLWGRSVYDNIRKFLQFQLTVNVVALTVTFLSAVGGYQPPLNAVMMLWVNLIMDTMGALALGTEPPTDELLLRAPYKRDSSLVSRPMWRNIFVQSVYQLWLLLFMLFEGPEFFSCVDGSTHHFTLLFNAFVFCQLFNEFNAREIGDDFRPLSGLHKSPMFIAVVVVTVLGQYWIVEKGGEFTGTVPLTEDEWIVTAVLGSFSIPLGLLMRLIPVSEDPRTFASENKEAASKQTIVGKVVQLVGVMVPVGLLYGTLQILQDGEAVSMEGIVSQWLLLIQRFATHYAKVDNPDLDVVAGEEL